ncbi:hypothetical protein ETAA8_16530 [Anatilimnocola aggregata]|uniref:DUF1501 domain-containing protein n=1 Tax=Anatilimnocola aggregata TaxID=2528021 RepID=A0A517Y8M5_9BACT|nr:DUF1501 domain-containing protein [Anatilimnocola aggregata]QDU26573.1 hypothetical protein ETAA8_16530 [Anatilimnocola aggregata]
MNPSMTRRDALRTSAAGFGSLALAALCRQAQAADGYVSPLAARQPHFPAKVKRVIFMFMEGGPSHVDTFDYKPELYKADGKALPYEQPKAGTVGKEPKLMKPPFKFAQHGESGLWISEVLPHLARHADDLCLINGMFHDTGLHEAGCVMMHTGEFRFTRPSIGSWITYGLGSESENLPAYVSVNPRDRNESSGCYSNAFLPAVHHATIMRGVSKLGVQKSPPIRNVNNPILSTSEQRRQLDFVQRLNVRYQQQKQSDSQIDAVIESFERAYRMQSAVPELLEVGSETKETLELYGLKSDGSGNAFAVQCLLARRMAEAGVRFIEISQGGWDHHAGIATGIPNACRGIDQPIAGLITDLKQRGLWNDTLLVWGGEFGRTPVLEQKPNNNHGRDHNGAGFTYWLAGGGVKGGLRYGATDELGYFAAENKVKVHELHATVLHLLGLDHQKLTYRYGGRDYTLTDVDGEVVRDILA